MGISQIILLMYAVVIVIIAYRVWSAIKSMVDTIHDRKQRVTQKLFRNRYGLWGNTLTAATDIGLSLLFAVMFSAIIAGIGSAAVGALAGVAVSVVITSSRRYSRHKRNHKHQNQ